jgi:hypothetical protein
MKRVPHQSSSGSLRSLAATGGLLTLSLLALLACSDDRANAAARDIGGGTVAAERMVSEYCNKEATCGAISSDEEAACVARLRPSVLDEYDTEACDERVSETELGRCLMAVRNGDCGNPLDALSQLDSCRAHRVCRPRR